MRLNRLVAWPVLMLGLSAPVMLDCSAKDLAEGCDEFNGGVSGVASLSIDAKAKAFVQAAADLQAVANDMRASVKAACVDIDSQLGVPDTWSSINDQDNSMNEACAQASAKIDAILKANSNITVVVTVSGGQCSVDATEQINCEGSCKADVSCSEGGIEVRCDPGQLSGQCSGQCKGSAVCEGTATVAAQCSGTCDAQCTGTCGGSCTGSCNGTCTGTCDGNSSGGACAGTCKGTCAGTCTGKCDATCTGTCTGNCTLAADANINCGANVSCKGGCTVAYTAPKCEGELTPPKCQGDANCQASCSSHASVHATCTQPTVSITMSGTTDDLVKLKAALDADLPKLWLAAKTQGALALKGTAKLATTGAAVVSSAASIGGKAVACVAVAAQASVKAQASVSVSVQASASVSGSAGAG